MGICRDRPGDLAQMCIHSGRVRMRHDQRSSLGAFGTNRAEDIARRITCITRRTRPGSPFGPYTCQRPLLTHTSFVLKPNLQWFAAGRFG